MWNDPTELFVGQTGAVYVAVLGTTLPTNESSSLDAAFSGVGYLTEDGVTVTRTPTITDYGAWQSIDPVRRERTNEEFQVSFSIQQWNDATVPFAFGGGSVVDLGSNHYRFDPPAQDAALDERILVIDVQDGTRKNRFVIKRGNVTEATTAQFARAQASQLPIGFKALAPSDGSLPWNLYSNDQAAYAVGS